MLFNFNLDHGSATHDTQPGCITRSAASLESCAYSIEIPQEGPQLSVIFPRAAREPVTNTCSNTLSQEYCKTTV